MKPIDVDFPMHTNKLQPPSTRISHNRLKNLITKFFGCCHRLSIYMRDLTSKIGNNLQSFNYKHHQNNLIMNRVLSCLAKYFHFDVGYAFAYIATVSLFDMFSAL